MPGTALSTLHALSPSEPVRWLPWPYPILQTRKLRLEEFKQLGQDMTESKWGSGIQTWQPAVPFLTTLLCCLCDNKLYICFLKIKNWACVWIMLPAQIHTDLEPVHVTSYGNRASADVIKSRWGRIGLGWTLNPMTGVLRRRTRGHRDTQGRNREEGQVRQMQRSEKCSYKPRNGDPHQ